MKEVLPRWKWFAKAIEIDLQTQYGIDIGDWHTGKMSSRRLLVLTDGLIGEKSWYKHELHALIEDEKSGKNVIGDVKGIILAQLTGQEDK